MHESPQNEPDRLEVAPEAHELGAADLEAVIASVQEPIVIADERGRILSMNRPALQLHQFETIRECRRAFSEYSSQFELHSPDGQLLPPDAWPIARATRGEVVRDMEVHVLRQDTDRRWVGLYSARPFVSASGRKLVTLTIRDITARRQRERELLVALSARQESEQHFRTLADNIAQLAWMADPTGWIFWYNQRWFDYTGTTLEEMQGWGWRQVHHPEHVERVTEKIRHSFQTGTPWEDTFPLRGRDGTYRWFLSRAIPIHDEAGRVLRWFGTNTDITEQREAELALQEADRRKDEFLGVLSHELRNPLTPIRNALHLLERAPAGSEPARRARAIIDRQVDHLSRLVEDLLDVTRISRGKIHLRRERVELLELVRHTAEDHRSLFAQRNLSFEVRLEGGPLWLEADATRLAQVVGNLLQNAARFTEAGGAVTLEVERDASGQALLRVKDEGVGIAPEMIPRLFAPFVQADESLHRSRGGLGLGLALVKGLVELHGGTVAVHSEGLGRGAEFTLRLPLLPTEERMQTPETTSGTSAGQLRVLVVEDNPDIAETLQMIFELEEQQVEVAHDGREGLERARAFKPDLVLCDIGLPVVDGYQVARELRASPEFTSTFLVALSGYALPEDQKKASQAGFDQHLAKPVRTAQLQELIARAREKRSQTR